MRRATSFAVNIIQSRILQQVNKTNPPYGMSQLLFFDQFIYVIGFKMLSFLSLVFVRLPFNNVHIVLWVRAPFSVSST